MDVHISEYYLLFYFVFLQVLSTKKLWEGSVYLSSCMFLNNKESSFQSQACTCKPFHFRIFTNNLTVLIALKNRNLIYCYEGTAKCVRWYRNHLNSNAFVNDDYDYDSQDTKYYCYRVTAACSLGLRAKCLYILKKEFFVLFV